MPKIKEHIDVVWFKRDLRLEDNEALFRALETKNRVLLLYSFENFILNDPHYSERHFNFIKESIRDINSRLETLNTSILSVTGDVFSILNQIQSVYKIETIFSHVETGILATFNRDKEFKRYCRNNLINWIETKNNGVERGLVNRDNWFENWEAYMAEPLFKFNAQPTDFLNLEDLKALETILNPTNLETPKETQFQKGGSTTAWKYADSFFESRHKDYMFNISKPEYSRTSCSRLSPYISWGNVSIRQIFQKGQEVKQQSTDRRHIGAFLSRLRWQAHFIQKFEMEHTMEHASVNKGYQKLKKSVSEKYQRAWREGQTGFPLVDASMRCLIETGYVNFRMRAMLASFFTHILWQPWQDASAHLSQQFLDFEPGIHFPQLQMQAGETGINNLRIYNPTTNSLKHDPDATFIKKWVPELAHLDTPFIHEPYLMTPMESAFYNFELGKDYPKPIVDIKENRKKASDILWNMKKDPDVIRESFRILKRHTISDRNRMLRTD
ncbi:deoxyribodipyrimidine photo-lyase family protein (cryptochrome) [Winogradskyella wandonensis]|uniref:Deoxyribodipyrimidine photo-lyase family protein (Cryptochrome) n=1 Tax=Winogradskyella wandonensis TaxID=1442586 RepID=A0A4R1KKB0_9FLAO|nr:deoxyribodipyrimidine photo-lyase [Winogradskyella wandonensis]TCK64877.1 deoxyribodipyrimidine photo-lyase family protein (cryptochrome) [Winogradskyella wandonensis]